MISLYKRNGGDLFFSVGNIKNYEKEKKSKWETILIMAKHQKNTLLLKAFPYIGKVHFILFYVGTCQGVLLFIIFHFNFLIQQFLHLKSDLLKGPHIPLVCFWSFIHTLWTKTQILKENEGVFLIST